MDSGIIWTLLGLLLTIFVITMAIIIGSRIGSRSAGVFGMGEEEDLNDF